MTNKDDDIIVCRCEEITLGEIKKAIREGARDVNGIKRRTRAGMGLCQGRTCEKLVQQIIKEEINKKAEDIEMTTYRPPARPVILGTLGRNLQ